MRKLNKLIHYFINSICYLRYKKPILISAWVDVKFGKIIHRNWGDELNIYLLELLTGRNVLVANNSLFHYIFPSRNFICIGSILGWYENKNSEIWGTGAMIDSVVLRNRSVKIHLVRGKYTRQLLLQQGVECPAHYGDPALLLSKLYIPNVSKRYRMGIIPHHDDENQAYINNYVTNHDDVCFISMTKYNHWTDVIDKINSCSFIISSSLHGLIVSDSYAIPNVWVAFSKEIEHKRDFKYRDYFSSVKRNDSINPIIVLNEQDLNLLYNLKYEEIYEKAEIDFDGILNSCPFL